MLLIDHSAWSRLLADGVPKEREEVVLDWIEEGRLATCLPFLLEAGYSAQGAADYREVMARLGRLPHFPVDQAVERAALEAQSDLALIGHHRLASTDLIIAACAHLAGGGVLHYDRDYDLIAEHTRLNFESVWLAEPGTI
ncbi:MAG TPA: PIN domain-containing protein [Solirubrobacterales bacterium]|nr:PIN domain-containing protein [Solirubrobacterales bacterium]